MTPNPIISYMVTTSNACLEQFGLVCASRSFYVYTNFHTYPELDRCTVPLTVPQGGRASDLLQVCGQG